MLFVGAGASVDPPSILPLFAEMAEQVAEMVGAGPAGPDSSTPEARLEEIASGGSDVHAIVGRIISRSPGPNPTHAAVTALARSGGSVRIVTTNYDRHLSACLPEEIIAYDSPVLPGGDDFSGVVHIHGSIRESPERLVITTSDFAKLYMDPPSPTLGFLQQLFSAQAVLFIGYSLRDTLMQYVLRAVKSGAELYTLTDKPELPQWGTLGVEAVDCGSRENIPAVLTEWAQVAGASNEEHAHRVTRILASQPEDGGLSPRDESDLAYVVSSPDLVRIFTERARGPVWLRWASTRPDSKLFAPASELGPVDHDLVAWFAWHHNDDDATAAEATRLIIENQGRLHETLWMNMVMASNPRGGASAETANPLLLALADTVVPGFELRLLGLVGCCETPRDDDLLVELVDRMCRPKLREPDPFWRAVGQAGLFSAECQDPSGDVFGGEPDREFWSRRRHLAADLLSIVDGHIRSVQRIHSIAGNPDPYDGRPAIEPHAQNTTTRRVNFLVDAARDLWEILYADLPGVAVGYLELWAAAPWVVLNRLAVHGWCQRSDVTADEKLTWLLEREGWIHDNRLHHESMRLIAETVPQASEHSIQMLIDQITSGAEHPRRLVVFNKLGWIAQHAPSSPAAQTAFAGSQAANPEQAMVEHPDLLWWRSSIDFGPVAIGYIEGTSPQDLADRLQSDPTGTAASLVGLGDCITSSDPIPPEWARVLNTVHEATELVPAAGIALLEALSGDPATNPRASSCLASAVLTQLTTSSNCHQAIAAHQERLESLLPILWDVGIAHWPITRGDPSPRSWLDEAINSWPGRVVCLTLERIDAQYQADPDTWTGLDDGDKHLLEKITTGDSHETHLAQAALAHRTFSLHCADSQWTAAHLLPFLDPRNDAERAVRCWDAYLFDPRISAQLLEDGLLDHFLASAPHVHDCCRDAQDEFAQLAARLCFVDPTNGTDSTPPWLIKFTANASDSTRVGFINATAYTLREADAETRAAHWHSWMHSYWRDRLERIPRQLTREEGGALVDWAILLDDDFPAAVELVRAVPTPLEGSTILGSAGAQLSNGSGPLVNTVDRHPDECARLLAHLLENTSTTTAQRWDISLTPLIRRLKDRTNSDTFKPIREQLHRLGWIAWILNNEN